MKKTALDTPLPQPQTFKFFNHSVRAIAENDKVLFCGKDVAATLGYASPKNAISTHCRWGVKRTLPHPQSLNKTITMTFIPEGDAYRLIARSQLESAQEFESWLFDEVAPAVIKTGGYANSKAKPVRGQEELNARSLATTLRQMARSKAYPEEMKARFLAEAAATLSGNPITQYLPPIKDEREGWLSATMIAGHFKVSPQRVGLHGETDQEHQWSQPLWDKSRYSDKQVVSYVYNPHVVLPALAQTLEVPQLEGMWPNEKH